MTVPDGVLVHATAVALGRAIRGFGGTEGVGVLLLGEPGSGKSDLALRLIAEGGCLISDDQTLLSVRHDRLYARAPETIKGLIELRGVGIVKLDPVAGAPIVLAVQLGASHAAPRLPEPGLYVPPPPLKPGRNPPIILLNPFEASATARVSAAAAAAETGRFVAGVAPQKSP